jgi:predicted Zn-dependent protease
MQNSQASGRKTKNKGMIVFPDEAGAVEGLARAAQMAPGNLGQQASLIPKFIALGEYQQAAEAIERALPAAPRERQMTHSYASLCEFLLEHGDLNNAKRILTSDLLVRWPDASETACVQGEVALQEAAGKDDIAAAAKLFQKCLELEPGNVPAKLQLGIAYSRLGELAKAEHLLRAALDKRTFDTVAVYQLGEVLQQQGKTAEATKCLDEHKRISELRDRRKQLEGQYTLRKYQPADLLELARIYSQLGELKRAASTLRVYNQLKPADADGQRELAQVSLKVNETEGAHLAVGNADSLEAKARR